VQNVSLLKFMFTPCDFIPYALVSVVNNDIQYGRYRQERESRSPRSGRQERDKEIVHGDEDSPCDRLGNGARMTVNEKHIVLWFAVPLNPIPCALVTPEKNHVNNDCDTGDRDTSHPRTCDDPSIENMAESEANTDG
jgi:hypothetical protein